MALVALFGFDAAWLRYGILPPIKTDGERAWHSRKEMATDG